MYSTVDAMKQKKMTFGNNIRSQGSSSRLKSTINNSPPTFERINVTNEFLQGLLIHFRRQQ
jgi:hypothetical protein